MTTPTPEAARELLAEIEIHRNARSPLSDQAATMLKLADRCRPILAAYAEQAERIAKLTDSSPGTLRGRFQGMLDEIVRRGIATGHEGEPPESKLWKHLDRVTAECEAARLLRDGKGPRVEALMATKPLVANWMHMPVAVDTLAAYDAARAANTSEIPNSSTTKEPTDAS